jgi:hypothetical protein
VGRFHGRIQGQINGWRMTPKTSTERENTEWWSAKAHELAKRVQVLEDALHEICGESTEQGVVATAEIALGLTPAKPGDDRG